MPPPGTAVVDSDSDRAVPARRSGAVGRAYYGLSHSRNARANRHASDGMTIAKGSTYATRARLPGRRAGGAVAGLRWDVFAGGSARSRHYRVGAPRLSRGAAALEPGREPATCE